MVVISLEACAKLAEIARLTALPDASGQLVRLGIYQHYKGPLYQVMGICRHTETEDELVYYRSLYGGFECWVRPLGMFFETVEHGGRTLPRFTFVGDHELK